MSAKDKLNEIWTTIAFVVAGLIGLGAQSWSTFFIALVIILGGLTLMGNIRS